LQLEQSAELFQSQSAWLASFIARSWSRNGVLGVAVWVDATAESRKRHQSRPSSRLAVLELMLEQPGA